MSALLAELRYSGASIRLNDTGGLVLKGASPSLIDRIKSAKDQVIATLRAERMGGVQYANSALCGAIEELVQRATRLKDLGIEPDACLQLRQLAWDVEETAIERGMAAAQAQAVELRESAMALAIRVRDACGGPLLHGAELHQAVKEHLGDADTKVAAAEPVKERKVNLAAFK